MANLHNISEKKARCYKIARAGLVTDDMLVRAWEQINLMDIDELVEILRKYTSLKNYQDKNAVPTVQDPYAQPQKYEGLYRNVSVSYEKGQGQSSGTIIQILAKGYAQTLDDAESRIVGGNYNAIDPAKILQIQYMALDNRYIKSILENTHTGSFKTDPTFEGQEFSGTWRIIRNEPLRAEDGSWILTQVLVNGWISDSDSYNAADSVLLNSERKLLSPFMHDTTSVEDTTVSEFRGVDPDYAEALKDSIGLIDGNLSADIRKADDGSCSLLITNTERDWQGNLSQVWQEDIRYPDFNAQEIRTTYSHIPKSNASTYKNTLGSADVGYEVLGVVEQDTENGYVSLTQTQKKSIDTVAHGTNDVMTSQRFIHILGVDADIKTMTWIGVPDTDVETAMSNLATPPSNYNVARLANNYVGQGLTTITCTLIRDGVDTEVETSIEYPTFDAERKSYTYFGIKAEDVEDKYDALQTTEEAGYKVDSVSKSAGQEGLVNITQTISKTFLGIDELGVTADNGTDIGNTYNQLFGTDAESITTVWLGVNDANLASAMTTLKTAPTGYVVTNITHNYNGTGKANVQRAMIKKGATDTPKEIARQYPNYDSEQITFMYLNLDSTDADTVYSDALTTIPVGYEDSDYIVRSVNKQRDANGVVSITQVISKAQESVGYSEAIRAANYVPMFGLITQNTTTVLNVKKDNLSAVKSDITGDATKIILSVQDDDNGSGSANISYSWQSSPSLTSLGAVRSRKPHAYAEAEEERVWFNLEVTDADTVKDAVANALAGSGSYAVTANEHIISASGQDLGNKTAQITQVVRVNYETPQYLEYKAFRTLNTHGLQVGYQEMDIREYPELLLDDFTTAYNACKTFITISEEYKGSIQCSFNRGMGNYTLVAVKHNQPTWSNTTPDYVRVGTKNANGWGENFVYQARGVPISSAVTKTDAATAENEAHSLEGAEWREGQEGEAIITKSETKTDGTIVTLWESPGYLSNPAFKETEWRNIPSDEIDTYYSNAETHNVGGVYGLAWRTKKTLPSGYGVVTNRVIDANDGNSHRSFCSDLTLGESAWMYTYKRKYSSRKGGVWYRVEKYKTKYNVAENYRTLQEWIETEATTDMLKSGVVALGWMGSTYYHRAFITLFDSVVGGGWVEDDTEAE